MSSSPVEDERVTWFLRRKAEIVNLVSLCSELHRYPFLLAAQPLLSVPDNELHLKLPELTMVIRSVQALGEQRKQNQASEAAQILIDMRLPWQQQNSGQELYRKIKLTCIKDLLKRKKERAGLFSTDEVLENCAKRIEQYHFSKATSLEDYNNAEIAFKHYVEFAQMVRDMHKKQQQESAL